MIIYIYNISIFIYNYNIMDRPSPLDSATKYKIGTVKKGNDGNMWIVISTSTGIHRWKKYNPHDKHKKAKKYFIHDNGTRCFLVFIEQNQKDNKKENINVYVYTVKYFDKKNTVSDYDIFVTSFKNVKQVFVGKDAEYGYTGNTILLKLKDKYVYIGERIYEFKTIDTIEKYYSTVGNNDVPYPVAVGTKYAYFMLDNVYVDKTLLPNGLKTKWPYAYFDYYTLKSKKVNNKMKNFKVLKKRLL